MSKEEEYIFNKLWEQYLRLEQRIIETSEMLKEQPSESLVEIVYDLCGIAIGMNNTLEYYASRIFDGQTLSTFKLNCAMKKNDLHELSSMALKTERSTKNNRNGYNI